MPQITNCRIFSIAERVRNNRDGMLSVRVRRNNIDKLSALSPQGIKGLYIRPPLGCLEASASVVYGYPGPNGILQHKTIAGRVGLREPEAGEKDPEFWGFRIAPVSFVYGNLKRTYFTSDDKGRFVLAVWEGHRGLIEDSLVNVDYFMREIGTATTLMLRKSHLYGYLFPRGEEYAIPWAISARAGINPGVFPYRLASDLLQAVSKSVSPDFFIFDLFTHRPVYVPSPETCASLSCSS